MTLDATDVVEATEAPEAAGDAAMDVQIIINSDEKGRRELVIDTGVCAMVLGPDLVNTLERVLFDTSDEVEMMSKTLKEKGLKES